MLNETFSVIFKHCVSKAVLGSTTLYSLLFDLFWGPVRFILTFSRIFPLFTFFGLHLTSSHMAKKLKKLRKLNLSMPWLFSCWQVSFDVNWLRSTVIFDVNWLRSTTIFDVNWLRYTAIFDRNWLRSTIVFDVDWLRSTFSFDVN